MTPYGARPISVRYARPDDAVLVGHIELVEPIVAAGGEDLRLPGHLHAAQCLLTARERPIPVGVDEHAPLDRAGRTHASVGRHAGESCDREGAKAHTSILPLSGGGPGGSRRG